MKILKIESCKDCPFHSATRDFTEDSFEYVEKWRCEKLMKFIRRYVDWYDKDKFIPDECPLEEEEES